MPASSPIRAEAASLRASHRWLRRAAWGAGAAALGLVPLVLLLPLGAWQSALVLTLLLAYAASKGRRLARTRRALRQLRLEERFLQQPLEAAALRTCLRKPNHFWSCSRTWQGLRHAQRRARARLLPEQERRRRVQACYRHAFRAARPSLLSLDAGLAVLLLATGAALGVLSSGLGAAGLGAVLALEGAQGALRYALQRDYEALTAALADWTLARRSAFHADDAAAYRHLLLYEAQPWFSNGRAREAHGAEQDA